MKILNIHSRVLPYPIDKVVPLLNTLATKNDKIWPKELWPAMRFKEGLREGAHGGHGPIKYYVSKIIPDKFIQFNFTEPKGFSGIHQLEISELENGETELKHVIDMEARGLAILTWSLGIRWLHDALIEDAFDKVENQFSEKKKRTKWNWWVKFLRWGLG